MLPLAGVKVIDISQLYPGPTAAMFLADQGADVVKVEPLEGDGNRRFMTTPYLEQFNLSRPFLALNRNKRSIAVNYTTTEGQEIVHNLVRRADVFVTSFRPGTEARFRLDYETLAAVNPRLIYAAFSGFGTKGPEANSPGYDVTIQGRSGILSTRRGPDGTPVPSRVMILDYSSAIWMSYAIMVALWERERTGKGQRADLSMFHSALTLQMDQLARVGNDPTQSLGQSRSNRSYCFECADGKWIINMLLQPAHWQRFCRALELEALTADPRFATAAGRNEQIDELFAILRSQFRTRPSADWLERLNAEGVPCSIVAEQDEVENDPQAIANEMFWEEDHPAVGPFKTVSPPFQLSNTSAEARLRRSSPDLGQHTREVLGEIGYGAGDIKAFFEKGIVK